MVVILLQNGTLAQSASWFFRMIIFRYLSKEIIYTMLAVFVIFLLIFLSTQVALYLRKMAEGQLAASVLLQLIWTMIPTLSGLLLPMAFFMAILLAYGRLYADSEMTVLQACGLSDQRLLGYTIVLGLGVSLLVCWIVMIVSPRILTYQATLLTQTAANNLVETIIPGQFQETPDGKRVFYAEQISRDRTHVSNIFTAQQGVQTMPNPQKTGAEKSNDAPVSATPSSNWDIVFAKSAEQQYQPQRGGMFMVANDGYRYIGQPGALNFMVVHYGTYGVKLPMPRQDNAIPLKEQGKSTAQLWNDRNIPVDAAELQWRISVPLQTFILCLLAVPLSRVKPRQGRYAALLPAVLIYVFYANMLFAARNWVEKSQIPSSIGMWWIHLLLLLLAIYLFLGRPGWEALVQWFSFYRRARHV